MLKLGGQTTKVLDKGSIELVGPFGLEIGLVKLSKNLSNLDSGVITSYALYILTGLISYLLIPYLSVNFSNLLLLVLFCLIVVVTTGNILYYQHDKSVFSCFYLKHESNIFRLPNFKQKKFTISNVIILFIILSVGSIFIWYVVTLFDLNLWKDSFSGVFLTSLQSAVSLVTEVIYNNYSSCNYIFLFS